MHGPKKYLNLNPWLDYSIHPITGFTTTQHTNRFGNIINPDSAAWCSNSKNFEGIDHD